MKEEKIKLNRKNINVLLNLLEKASCLVGNPGANISSSTDIACDNWQEEYKQLINKLDK